MGPSARHPRRGSGPPGMGPWVAPRALSLMRLVPKWRKCHLRLPIAMGLLLSVLRQMFGHPRLAAPPKSAYSDGIPC